VSPNGLHVAVCPVRGFTILTAFVQPATASVIARDARIFMARRWSGNDALGKHNPQCRARFLVWQTNRVP